MFFIIKYCLFFFWNLMNDNAENDYSIRNSDNLFGSEALQGLIGQGFNSLAFERNVEEIILEIGNDFLENIIDFAIKAAKLRGSETLDQKDLKFSFGID